MRAEVAPFAPLLVDDRSGITSALIDRRHALGLTGEDLDERVGWADRYTGKLEAPLTPSGKVGFHFTHPVDVLPTGTIRSSGMAACWMQALGLRLVLVDAATAERIGAKPAPDAPNCRAGSTGGNAAPGHALRRKAKGLRPIMSAPAFEAADRTLVAGLSFRAAVTDHPWITEKPKIKAKAEAIEAEIASLYELIREGQ